MADAEAEGSMLIDTAQAEAALRDLEAHLGALEKKFANAGPGITSHLQGIDTAARQAATGLQATSAAGAASANGAGAARGGFMGLINALTTLSHYTFLIPNGLGIVGTALGNLLGKIHPLGPAFVKAFSDAIPQMKHALHMLGAVSAAGKALQGNLTGMGAVHGYLAARAVGVGRAHAGMGAIAGLALSGIKGGAGAAGFALQSLGTTAASSMGAAGGAMMGLLGKAGLLGVALAGIVGTMALLKKAISVSGDFERTTTSFRSLIGNAAQAKQAIDDLIHFSDSTPFDKFEMTEAGRSLLAYGVHARDLVPMLRSVTDVAAAMNRPVIDVANAFGQIKMGNIGVMTLRQLGLTKNELEAQGLQFDASGSYLGSVQQAMDAVRAAIAAKFGGATEDLSKTWGGLWSKLASRVGVAMRAIGEPIMEQLKPLLLAAVNLIEAMKPMLIRIGQIIARMLQTINRALGFRPVIPADRPDRAPVTNTDGEPIGRRTGGRSRDAVVGALRERGGGGSIGLGFGGDPILNEAQRHTKLLEQIAEQTRTRGDQPGRPTPGMTPYFA